MKGHITKVFSGRKYLGRFFSYYLICWKGYNRIFVMKGGPGVGKSTLMKNRQSN